MFRIFILVILSFSHVFALGEGRCGTVRFADAQKKKAKRVLTMESDCPINNATVKVSEKRTANFIIYYVNYTETSPHAIKDPKFIDSLAHYLEGAYKLHKDSLGLKGISGVRQTWHYRKNVPSGLYPVEVLDLGLFRGEEGDYATAFGLTFPFTDNPNRTQIAIENDFLYGADCDGKQSTNPFMSKINGNYSVKWPLALKVTAYHELYHAFQFMYASNSSSNSFWHEASATGVETIGAPEVKDYISYLSTSFNNPGVSMEDTEEGYEYVTLYLFLFKKLGAKFDSKIWDYFSKSPKDKFAAQLAKLMETEEKAEELFNEYASDVFFSGHRASVQQAVIWWPEQELWPLWNIKSQAPGALPGAAIDFVKASGVQKPFIDSVQVSHLEYGDSSVWVLSRLLGYPSPPEPEPSPEILYAYPNPWNPAKKPYITFNLTKPFGEVEIRSSNGALLGRVKDKTGSRKAEWQPEGLVAPGILYYRMLPYGKTKVLIVEW